jgi:hypothetical protein
MNSVSRRRALKTLGAAAASSALGPQLQADGARFQSGGQDAIPIDALLPIAEAVLPTEIGVDGRRDATSAFVRWIRNYKEGADTDHGYGNTRIRSTGPSPARNYVAQLTALDEAARAKGAVRFADAPIDVRRAIIQAALVAARVERLPPRPTGAHIASDLMGHYFNSPSAEDRCYHAAIGRDSCRGLPGSEARPAALKK